MVEYTPEIASRNTAEFWLATFPDIEEYERVKAPPGAVRYAVTCVDGEEYLVEVAFLPEKEAA